MKLQVGVKVLIHQDGKYLFLRRSAAFKAGPQKWDIPGGRIEPDEPLGVALAREVHEETGLQLTGTDKLLAAQDIFVPNKEVHVVRLTYIGRVDGDVIISDEHDDYRWMTLEAVGVEPHVDSYLKEVLQTLESGNG
ncbi:MAG TPA: NUDIX domain-containing protein [Candidatus Saccharibacteria bacterium]|nr:NUDIX domain-containing protein [Candidatus Saccharibacteria bacterium]